MEVFATPDLFAFLAVFTFVTASFHTYYLLAMNTHDSSIRFLEYFVTASIMIVVIAILIGIRDVFTLIGAGSLIATTMIFGYLEEKVEGVSPRPHYLGYVPYVAAWVILSWQFIRVAIGNEDIPDFVIAIFVGEVLLFSCFGYVQFHYMDAPNKLEMEGAYNLLSLTSKMLLVWLCVGGVMGQDGD